jgi:hypothetical protein
MPSISLGNNVDIGCHSFVSNWLKVEVKISFNYQQRARHYHTPIGVYTGYGFKHGQYITSHFVPFPRFTFASSGEHGAGVGVFEEVRPAHS